MSMTFQRLLLSVPGVASPGTGLCLRRGGENPDAEIRGGWLTRSSPRRPACAAITGPAPRAQTIAHAARPHFQTCFTNNAKIASR